MTASMSASPAATLRAVTISCAAEASLSSSPLTPVRTAS